MVATPDERTQAHQKGPATLMIGADLMNASHSLPPHRRLLLWAKLLVGYALRGIQHLFNFLPLRQGRVLLDPAKHPGYSCNLKYTAEHLRTLSESAYTLYWVSEHPDSCGDLRARGIPVIRRKSCRHFFLHHTAQFILYSDSVFFPLARRRGQVYVQTWHAGMNYKRIGFVASEIPHDVQRRLFTMANPQPDIYVSGSAFFTADTAASFHFDPAVFLPCGLPRNDLLFHNPQAGAQAVRAHYSLAEGQRIALIAPTFRSGLDAPALGLDLQALKAALQERFGGEWAVLLRQHAFTRAPQEEDGLYIPTTDYPDMQELLCAADVLLSDYSSCLWDFTFLSRPAFVYAPDLDAYRDTDRGFAYPLEKWPYPIAQTQATLLDAIRSFDAEAYAVRVAAHHRDACAYETGTAAAQLEAAMRAYSKGGRI